MLAKGNYQQRSVLELERLILQGAGDGRGWRRGSVGKGDEAPGAPPRPQMPRISRTSIVFQFVSNQHLKNLKNLYCFTMSSFHQVAKYCETTEIDDILEVYI